MCRAGKNYFIKHGELGIHGRAEHVGEGGEEDVENFSMRRMMVYHDDADNDDRMTADVLACLLPGFDEAEAPSDVGEEARGGQCQ